mgnify:CR=1 FL=1|jgi:drug/metabolite transporter (DMT)-like permease
MKPKKGYVFLIILAALFWSLDALIRRQLSAIPSSIIVLLEHSISSLVALPFLKRFIPEYKKMNAKDWLAIAFIGVIGGGLAYVMYTEALGQVNNISYSVVALIQQTQPIFTVILATFLLKEKITKKYGLFALIALISAYFLTFPDLKPNFLGGREELIAASLAMGSAIFWGAATTLGKVVLKKISYAALAILRFLIVVPVAGLISLVLHQSYPLSSITSSQWGYLMILSLFSGIISFIIYYKGLEHTQAKVATFAELTWPVGAAFIGFFFLKESLTVIQVVAALILMFDILAISLTSQQQ